jgi:hypothetical protein
MIAGSKFDEMRNKASQAGAVHTPREVLVWEYNRLSTVALQERLNKLDLMPITIMPLARVDMINLLVEYTVEMESRF